jgi:hypothetical protein
VVNGDLALKRSALIALLDQVLYPPPRGGQRRQPWRAVFLARASIDRAAQQLEWNMASGAAEAAERALPAVQAQLSEMVDEWCGVRPPKWPWPWAAQPGSAQLSPLDLLLAGAQFDRAAQLVNPLRHDFAALSDQLFEAGLSRLALRTNAPGVHPEVTEGLACPYPVAARTGSAAPTARRQPALSGNRRGPA